MSVNCLRDEMPCVETQCRFYEPCEVSGFEWENTQEKLNND
jgi:hypothetical protein